MSNRKSFKVDEEEYKLIQRMKNITAEDKQRNRLDTIKKNEQRMTHNARAIIHKRDQIKNKESLEKEEGYIDGKKPLFMLQNEIDVLGLQNDQLGQMITVIQEEYDGEEKKD